MKRLFPRPHAVGEMRKSSQRPARRVHARVAAFAFLILCMSVIALAEDGRNVAGFYQLTHLGEQGDNYPAALNLREMFRTAVAPIATQGGRDYREAEAKRQRELAACMRPAELAYDRAVHDAQNEKRLADRKADEDYREAVRKATSDAARTAAKRAKQEALRKAQRELRTATMAARNAKQEAVESCRNPKPPETTNNNSGNNNSNKPTDSSAGSCVADNATEGTLGHGPRVRNSSVRMDLRVVDESGKPVQGVKTKLWSERKSNGLSCETVHTTDACGKVLMHPIHFTKTLQLKLESNGFEPQMIQVDPAQLDRPYRAVMQAKNRIR